MLKPFQLIFIVCVVFVLVLSGCTKNNSINEKYQNVPNNSQLNQEILSDLMVLLNSHPSSYSGRYKRETDFSLWAGHSGATHFITKSDIFIEVYNNQVIDYTLNYTGIESGNIKDRYYRYYDNYQKTLCEIQYKKDYYNVENSTCYNKIPENFDLTTKKEVVSYLGDIDINLLVKRNNITYGTCYYIIDKDFDVETLNYIIENLEPKNSDIFEILKKHFGIKERQTLCFNEESLISYAHWGMKSSAANFSIKTVEKV